MLVDTAFRGGVVARWTPLYRLLLGAIVAAYVVGHAATARAGAMVDAITIKWNEQLVADADAPLPDNLRTALVDALRFTPILIGRTRDGAFRFELIQPLSIDEARAAINRVRMKLPVLYASVGDSSGETVRVPGTSVASSVSDDAQPPIGRLIVKYRDASLSRMASQNFALPSRETDRLSAMAGQPVAHQRAMSRGAYVVRLFRELPETQARALAAYLETDPEIEYAEPDRRKYPKLIPNDPLYPQQWHYQSAPTENGGANLPPAWDITTGSSSIVIAVIDTGSLPLHPDLAGRYIGGYDMISDVPTANDGDGRDSDASDPGDWITSAENQALGPFHGCGKSNSSWHGTHVAGTIGAASNNGNGVAGINWVSKILPVRVLGKCGGFDSDIADGIVWAAGGAVPGVPSNPNPARVLNLSLGGGGACGATLQGAINTALGLGAVIAIAAGNDNDDAANSSPGNCDGVITVAAIGRTGQKASYSNYGALVEIAAPGGDGSSGVLSTLNDGLTSPDPAGYEYVFYEGTSMATPHVAGIASLILSEKPSLTPAQVMATIQATARAFPVGGPPCDTTSIPRPAENLWFKCQCTTALCGTGIIDAGAAVNLVAPHFTSTSLSSSSNPATIGSGVVFTATVTGAAPTGTITFSDGGSVLSGCNIVPLSGGGDAPTAQCSTSTLSAGTHLVIASYGGDTNNRASTSPILSQGVGAPGEANVALASTGAVATASSMYSAQYPVVAINDNDRKGLNWGNGGGWADGTANVFPDWVQITFSGSKTIDRVVVYTVQDNYTNPIEPTDTLTFSQYGVTDFNIQTWNGSFWLTQATVSNNNLVKRTITFPAVATNRIRINITGALASYSRINEVEAWGVAALGPPPATTTLTSSANPSASGSAVSFIATVGGTAPTGTVTFNDGGTLMPGCSGMSLAGNGNTRTANCTTTTLSVGTHNIVASFAGDSGNAASSSAPLSQVVNAGSEIDVALASNGGVASASSLFGPQYPAAAINNNERMAANWGNGGGWADGTANVFPDWVQIVFSGSKTIDRVVVYTVQDNYASPVEPTDTMTFSLYGITSFTVQGRQGSRWITLATVTGNKLVKRTVNFSPFATDRIRINVKGALASYSRITEVEAWGH